VVKADAEGQAQLAGAVGNFICGPGIGPHFFHEVRPLNRFQGTQEHGARSSPFFCDYIKEGIHVAFVDISPARMAEHGGIPFSEAFAGVASRVRLPGVGLGFHYSSGNPAAGRVMYEEHPYQFPGNPQSAVPEEQGGYSVNSKAGQGGSR